RIGKSASCPIDVFGGSKASAERGLVNVDGGEFYLKKVCLDASVTIHHLGSVCASHTQFSSLCVCVCEFIFGNSYSRYEARDKRNGSIPVSHTKQHFLRW